MKGSIFAAAAFAGSAFAHPGMRGLMKGFRDHARRQGPPILELELIGDLATDGATSDVGKLVLACLDGSGPCEVAGPKTYVAPDLKSDACAADTCCVWDYVQADLVKLFTNDDGTCTDLARNAVRFGFHDAGAWSKTSGSGGADGSLLLSPTEIERSENSGLKLFQTAGNALLLKYGSRIGAADLAQFAHNVATVVCPLGPRGITLIGRDDSTDSPTGLLPSASSDVTTLINLFADKTINFVDLVALIGAHTTAKQFFFDTTQAGKSFDSTPGVWDVAFYSETLADTPAPGTFRLPSDNLMARDNRTEGGFNAFSAPATGQALWNALYSKAYLRLSLLGVNKINKLTDCSHVLPDAKPVFPIPPKSASASLSASASATGSSKSLSSASYSSGTAYVSSSSTKSVSYSSGYVYPSSSSTKSVSYPPGYVYPSSSSTKSVSWPAGGAYPSKSSKSLTYTTSTIYVTKTFTITEGYVTKTYTTVAPSTTIYVVNAKPTKSARYTTETIYTTKTFTVTEGYVTKTSTLVTPVTTTVYAVPFTRVAKPVTSISYPAGAVPTSPIQLVAPVVAAPCYSTTVTVTVW